MPRIRALCLIGNALGSLVAAWLIVSLVAAWAPSSFQPFIGLIVVVLGGLTYADIRRRDRPLA
jgi:hypothetical protein